VFAIRERCHFCSKYRNLHEMIRIVGKGQRICWSCFKWHQKAMRMLGGEPPPGCQECYVTFDALQKISPDGNVSFRMHLKDGIYQILCRSCSDAYERKRLDLYGDTAYGWLRKLKGAK